MYFGNNYVNSSCFFNVIYSSNILIFNTIQNLKNKFGS
ncbi:hypothetical protein BD94_4003 [Elizabethkingia anophelis NUHP1]|uniref:Uncharacterized protein n=1 Tax=Elizabethkingia anophelis NUHP1 TaxID=1338011 RepID=A0A077EMT9_9FLAO|nr:hypothetical protein BD94_4003 [Elizabethkingia anophelis NUHP1]